MKLAYLIIAHKYPYHLLRMIKALYDENDYFVIHIDVRSEIKGFRDLLSIYKNVIFIEDRLKTEWGSFNLVQATLNGLKFIDSLPEVTRVVMLSGQDYPIKNNHYIKSFFCNNIGDIFIECFQIPWSGWNGGGYGRFPKYEEVNEIMTIYGGSQWFSIPSQVIDVIFHFLDLNPLFVSYYKGVFIPDESFFQTLLMNCGVDEITNSIISTNLHQIFWSNQAKHPDILDDTNILSLLSSDSLFARKFDPSISSSILNYIDRHILTHQQSEDSLKSAEVLVHQKICFLTNKDKIEVLDRYKKLEEDLKDLISTQLIFHYHTTLTLSDELKKTDPFLFTYKDFSNLGYKPILPSEMTGSNHFTLLKFYRENPQYEYYWYVEDDVYCNDTWCQFFGCFLEHSITTDFLSVHIRDYNEEPDWYWWDTLKFRSIDQLDQLKIRSFNPLFRISNRALKFIDVKLSEGWEGHYEVLLPTLLKAAKFSIGEFGGTGNYVLPGFSNKFYKAARPESRGVLSDGNIRYRPLISEEEISQNLISHPVKIDILDAKQK